jgi:molybdenum-dependent DNA-binding transcriptional regulator ModE
MTQSEERMGNPLIDEVRARRRALPASCGDDLRRLLERVEELQREHPEKLVDHRREAMPKARTPRE